MCTTPLSLSLDSHAMAMVMAPALLLPGSSAWTCGNAKLRVRVRVGVMPTLGSRVPSGGRGAVRKVAMLPGCRCAATTADGLDYTAAVEKERAVSPQQCTYGAVNVLWVASELQRLLTMQKNTGDGLVLTRGQWSWDVQEQRNYQFTGLMQFCNTSTRFELFVPEVSAKLQLLSNSSLDSITAAVQISSQHPNEKPPKRADGYWRGYITRAGESTAMQVVVDIKATDEKALFELQAVRVDVDYVSYGPHGRTAHSQHIILPVRYPVTPLSAVQWRKVENVGSVLPISTHLLSHLDDPLQVLKMYVLPHAKGGDIIAIGETPLAIMQGRFRHPKGVHPGLLAKLACRLFHPTSSLATACGMQSLIDISGRLRVVFAVIFAVVARLVGVRGMFYRLAGAQARLIDDVTGTLPPYDQFITLGPLRVQETVDALKAKTGCEVAVVDVNDLKKVQILAASDGVDHKALESALLDNPAGNADEQTPLVLVRKSGKSVNT
ncbi:hypothetical protein KC19_12G000200 [Ceratodon purpureus]|uniref:F420-0:Gamma-glutamyl ligase n=1 Tax=Ceratodon purpureus TaxID=3225 RepID=A0A8T0G619_CERPU|nr:hypothetical protein KC19_12G000200 [Ceratodon purpureus]